MGFRLILRDLASSTKNSVFCAVLADDGELVEYWDTRAIADSYQCATISAHHGVFLHHIRTLLFSYHFGEANCLTFFYRSMRVALALLPENYFAILACDEKAPLAVTSRCLRRAVPALSKEISG